MSEAVANALDTENGLVSPAQSSIQRACVTVAVAAVDVRCIAMPIAAIAKKKRAALMDTAFILVALYMVG